MQKSKVDAIKDDLDSVVKNAYALGKKWQDRQSISTITHSQLEYQAFYTTALAALSVLAPERVSDFQMCYFNPKGTSFRSGYTIDFAMRGIHINTGRLIRADIQDQQSASATLLLLFKQIAILQSAKTLLESALADLEGVLQADLFTSELEAA